MALGFTYNKSENRIDLTGGVRSSVFNGRNSDVLGVTTSIDVADPSNIRAHWNALQRDEIEDEVSQRRLSGSKCTPERLRYE